MKEYHKALHNATIVVDVFMQKTFNHIYFDGPVLSPEKLNANPIMAVCSHRSHVDYVLLGVQLHNAGIRNIRFAAGDNITNLPYAGAKFRSYGAFSVYRARALSRKYVLELCQQVMGMLDNGDNIIVFPEGGRSYNGNMMEMKNGIIAANILAQYRSPERRYLYLPVTVSYERLPELPYFNMLQKGKQMLKSKVGFFKKLKGNGYYYGADLIAYVKFLAAHKFGKRYGDVFIDYGEPIAVSDIVDVNKNYSSGTRNEFFAHKISIQMVGEEIRKQLLHLYRILPMHVVAAILKKSGSCSRAKAVDMLPVILTKLAEKNRNCKSLHPLSEHEIVEKGISQLVFFKAISIKSKILKIRNMKIICYYTASIE